jgi:hypothetical protein
MRGFTLLNTPLSRPGAQATGYKGAGAAGGGMGAGVECIGYEVYGLTEEEIGMLERHQ